MADQVKGNLNAKGLRFGIIVSRFNSFITERLLTGALDALERAGADPKNVNVVRVPGSFEIPVTAKKLGASGQYDALICLGAILRGETSHFEYVSAEVTRGVQRAALDTGVPMAFGVITVDTLEQAIDRAGAKSGNKGAEAALTAIEMANLLRRLPARASSIQPRAFRRPKRPRKR